MEAHCVSLVDAQCTKCIGAGWCDRHSRNACAKGMIVVGVHLRMRQRITVSLSGCRVHEGHCGASRTHKLRSGRLRPECMG